MEIRLAGWYPDVATRIRRLEKQAHDAGLKSCHWEPKSSKEIREAPGPLCSGCVFDPASDDPPFVITVTF